MTFYADMQSLATELLTEFGQNATWSRTEGGTRDPATGNVTGGTTTNYSGYGTLFDFNTMLIDGEQILATDKRFLIESGDIPKVADKLTINSVVYTVIAVNELNPAGTVVMYELQLRS